MILGQTLWVFGLFSLWVLVIPPIILRQCLWIFEWFSLWVLGNPFWFWAVAPLGFEEVPSLLFGVVSPLILG